jgi:hypothetical protein
MEKRKRHPLPAPSSPNWNGFKKGHPPYPKNPQPSFDLRTTAGRRYLDFITAYEQKHTVDSLQSRIHLENAASLYVAIEEMKEQQLKGKQINNKEYRLLINAQRRALAQI